MKKGRVLITSIGSRVGQSIMASIKSSHPHIEVFGTNSLAAAPALFACNKAFLTPPTGQSEDYLKKLGSILETQVDLVIPARDEELPLLTQLSEAGRFPDTHFFSPPQALIEVFTDKYVSSTFAKTHGLPFARTAATKKEFADLIEAVGFPIVAKLKKGGHSSKNVYLVSTREQAEAVLKTEAYILQELLNPQTIKLPNLSVDFGQPWLTAINDKKVIAEMVIGKQGELISLSCCHTEGNEMNNLIWSLNTSKEVADTARNYANIFGSLGYKGVLNLQGKCLEDGTFVVYELNGRFTGSAAVRTTMGYNQVSHALEHFLWGSGPVPQHHAQEPQSVVKMPQHYVLLNPTHLKTLTENGLWESELT